MLYDRHRGGRVCRAVAAVADAAAGHIVCAVSGGAGRAGYPGAGERAAVGGGRLAAFGVPLGLEAVPEVLLHPSVIERFAVSAPGLSGSARRTLRTNLRFLAREVVPALAPADAPLPRERARAPYSPAEIAGYLALADAQPNAVAADARDRAGLPGRQRRPWPARTCGRCAAPMSSAGPAG